MNASLFALTGKFLELSRMVEEAPDGEIDAALDAFLTDTEGQIEDKVDGYVGLIDELEAVATARKAEAKRLADLARTDENNAARLRERLREHLIFTGRDKLKTTRHNLRIQNAGGKLPLIISDERGVPPELTVTTVAPDKEKIRAILDAGTQLPYASLGERSKVLVIK